jgi:predicted GIY-YIG superfamily endonuclease
MKISGIYKIQSKIKSERIYIGSAIDIKRRRREHLFGLQNNKHGNQRFQNHYNKYEKGKV